MGPRADIVIEKIDSLTSRTVLNNVEFAFFKGINTPAVNGILTAEVTNGLPEGTYKLSTINSAANHQPVLVAVAQHGSLDDVVCKPDLICLSRAGLICLRPDFTVAANGGNNNGGNNNGGNNGQQNNGQQNNNGGQQQGGNNNGGNRGGNRGQRQRRSAHVSHLLPVRITQGLQADANNQGRASSKALLDEDK